MSFKLTKDQKTCLAELKKFINGDKKARTLTGYAGSGKTTLMRIFYNWLEAQGNTILGIAPTHKAKHILDSALNQGRYLPCVGMTVAGFLGKLPRHGYVGSKSFKNSDVQKILEFDVILVDECSMLSDTDVKALLSYVIDHDKKILFIGDIAQIPNPDQTMKYNKDRTVSKRDSLCFQLPTSKLTSVIRQSKSNPILKIYTIIRQDLFKVPNLPYKDDYSGGEGIRYYNDKDEFIKKIGKKLKGNRDRIQLYRVIAYTNETVNFYNTHIRKILGYTKQVEVHEVLMGYRNVGFPNLKIENGQEYIVNSVLHTKTYSIRFGRSFDNIVGNIVKIAYNGMTDTIFMPIISDPNNYDLLMMLQRLAKKCNISGSTKQDYIKYMSLKNKLIFMDDVYEFNGKTMSGSMLKSSHPLLFNNTTKYISGGKIRKNKVTQKFVSKYPDILQNRIDDDKYLGSSEKISDMFQIIEKDIDYGYAITSHKSQGSTYHTVFIDEDDFDKVSNRWNSDYEAEENGTKEKNQLLYVALTRPTHMALVHKSETRVT